MEPIRVLHENVIMSQGGIENFLMNVYRNIDRNKIQFDFLVHRDEKGYFDDEIRSLGGKIYVAPPFNPFHHIKYINGMKKIMKEHDYKIIHCHSELNMWALRVAKEVGITTRIAHSHNSETSVNLKWFFMKYQQLTIKRYCTDMFMCSEKAGEWAFGAEAIHKKNAHVVKNGIETARFDFNESVREKIRQEMGLNGKLVIGHVGRFMEQKNHKFLIDVFKEVLKKQPNAVLLLVGEGELLEETKNRVKQYGIEESVIFAGVRSDVNEIMQAMDVFVLPSLWEGLGIVLIEAQTAGLPCIASNAVPRDTELSENIEFLPFDKEKWVESVLKYDKLKRSSGSERVTNNGFDIKNTVQFLSEFYLNRQ